MSVGARSSSLDDRPPARGRGRLFAFALSALASVVAPGLVAAQTPDAGVPADAAVAQDAGAPDAARAPATPADAGPLPSAEPPATSSATRPREDRLRAADDHFVRYFLEDVEVTGNRRTRASVIRSYIPLEVGDPFEPDSPEVEAIEWRLRGTGWFDHVRLHLRRGSERGWVVLVVDVRERNTLVIDQIGIGIAEGLNGTRAPNARLVPYGAFSFAETNLLGLGMQLGVSAVVSEPQQGTRIDFVDPRFLGSAWGLRISPFFNNARQFFGRSPLVSEDCGPTAPPECREEFLASNAVVFYRRGGLRLGTSHDIGASTSLTLDWQGEIVHVLSRPEAASEFRGDVIRPIDFAIEDGTSFVSNLRLALGYDRRDDPGFPSRGLLFRFQGDFASRLIGSDYEFLKLQGLVRWWIPLPRQHSIRLGGLVGVIFGEAPFFYKFHISDLSDLIPSRALEMELDRRAAPNLLQTSIINMRNEEVALRLDIEWSAPIFRAREGRNLRRIHAYLGAGLISLADLMDLSVAIPGYEGFSRIPVDLTFDLGLRFDTKIGVFQVGLSNLLGFIAI